VPNSPRLARTIRACRTPSFKWAERVDKVFLTVVIPQALDVQVTLDNSGAVRVQALSGRDGLTYVLDVKLYGTIDAGGSKWFAHRDRVDLTLFKLGSKTRWFQLLEGHKTHPQLSTDWTKYQDYDDELDELEIKSGARGVPVPPSDHELKKAVDDYWVRKRVEERETSAMPNLEEVTKRAEREWEAGGKRENFQDVVQRIWQELTELRRRERELDAEEDAWAGWVAEPPAAPRGAAGPGGGAAVHKDEP